ncbi:MAG: HAD family phosphatase [Caulobacterales bacterium]|nr:HAD family phosphatase [Caulobacterales bacterium]
MNNNEIKAILCDFDGTLVDTSYANYKAYGQALEEVGLQISYEEFDKIAFGKNWRQFLPQLLEIKSINADAEKIALRKQTIYANYKDKIKFNMPLWNLVSLMKKSVKTAIVTTASKQSIEAIIDTSKINQFFDLIICGNDVKNHKPAPDAYFLAAQNLGIEPKNCLVYEDSEIGIASATSAQMNVIKIQFPT